MTNPHPTPLIDMITGGDAWAWSLTAVVSHCGFYMVEGTFYIRIRLPPCIVLGDRLASVSLWTY